VRTGKYRGGVYYIPGTKPDAKVQREAVIRSPTIDEDFRLANWLGFHVETHPEKGSITRYDYQVAIGQAVARTPGERMADVALQLSTTPPSTQRSSTFIEGQPSSRSLDTT
jgi:hypothetical protein